MRPFPHFAALMPGYSYCSWRDGTRGNGNPYSGTVAVERTGDTYRVTGMVGNTQYDGTGIGSDDFLAVSYCAGNVTGLALYGAKGNN